MDRRYVERNDRSRERLANLVTRLTDADLERQVTGWTITLTLLHLAFWDRFTMRRWETTIRAGELLPPSLGLPFTDLVNDAALDTWAGVTPSVARAAALAAAEACDRYVATLPDAVVEAAIAGGMERSIDRSAHRASHLDPIETEIRG